MPPIKLLHTADWHIGQLFHDYDRSYEHQLFLDWLVDTITAEQIDVLLVSGDIFDVSNPLTISVSKYLHRSDVRLISLYTLNYSSFHRFNTSLMDCRCAIYLLIFK